MRRLALFFLATLMITAHADAKPRAKKRTAKKASTPPVAYYLAEWGSVKGETREAAIEKCNKRRAEELKKHPDLEGYASKTCASTLVTVRGPYDRKGQKDPYADPSIYVYRGSDNVWYDSNGESPCFVAGTLVSTPDGDKPIESLQEGDVVWSWSFDTKARVQGVVEKTKRRVAPRVETLVLAGGASVTATPNHPFYSSRARTWVELGKLLPDDSVMVLDGSTLATRALASAPTTNAEGSYVVYDLTVSPHRNYFAAGMLVHNY
jgi:hypothetical protein